MSAWEDSLHKAPRVTGHHKMVAPVTVVNGTVGPATNDRFLGPAWKLGQEPVNCTVTHLNGELVGAIKDGHNRSKLDG